LHLVQLLPLTFEFTHNIELHFPLSLLAPFMQLAFEVYGLLNAGIQVEPLEEFQDAPLGFSEAPV